MHINVISESVFFPKGHGVHTAFLNHLDMLKKQHVSFSINSFAKSDITHIHTVGIFSLFKLLTSSNVIVTAHILPDSLVGSLIGSHYWIKFARKYLIYFYNKANLIFAVSPKVKEELIKLGVTTPIKTFPLSLDEKLFAPNKKMRETLRAEWNIKKNDTVLIGVGQIQSRKGIVDFVEIAKKLPEYIFVWVGSLPFGSLTEQSEDLKRCLLHPPENFKLVTTIFTYENMPANYNAADIFLFPSYQETFGLVVIEAASCGLPVILRDLPEYENTFKQNYLKANTINQFIENIHILKDPKKYAEYLKKSKEIASDFSNLENSLRMVTYYQNFLSGKKI